MATRPQPPLELPPRVVLGSIALFWALYVGINTTKWLIKAAPADEQLDMFWRRLLVAAFGIALTFLFHKMLCLFQSRPIRTRISAIALGSGLFAYLYAWVNFWAVYRLAPTPKMLENLAMLYEEGIKTSQLIVESAISWYFFFAAWGALTLALAYAARTREAERRATAYAAAAQEAQLRALRYQINPHFLFNTLNSLSALVLRDRPDDAERMIQKLSTFFRTSLTSDPHEDVPLAEELRLQRLYLEIEEVRFPDRLRVEIDVDRELEQACVPTLILQPLVENAIKYGVARARRPVTVRISAARSSYGGLILIVEDDGEEHLGPSGCKGAGVGLANVRARLEARFGGDADCSWTPLPGGGYRAAIRLPFVLNECQPPAPAYAYS